MERLEDQLGGLASYLGTTKSRLASFYDDLCQDRPFLDGINAKVKDVPQFEGKQFQHVDELRVYRCLLYCLVRQQRCEMVVETGVLQGFSSAFILLALKHNGTGRLLSVDLPGYSGIYEDQDTAPLPPGKEPGWLIPDYLRPLHSLYLGTSLEWLPTIFRNLPQPVDIFIHDSEHTYVNMMFEMSIAYSSLREGGILVCDNVEYNQAFDNFSQGAGVPSLTVYSFNTPSRVWKHGILKKPI